MQTAVRITDLDFQYAPSRSAKDFAGSLARYHSGTLAARERFSRKEFLDISYGPRPRQRLDVYVAKEQLTGAPVHVFLHGGFWQESSKDDAGFPAGAFVSSGAVYIAVNYTLAPVARLSEIVDEISTALHWIEQHVGEFGGDRENIVVSGHSAGAYLAASLAFDRSFSSLRGLVLVSGVYDLGPIAQSYVNNALHLAPEDVSALSLMAPPPGCGIPIRIFVGADETDAFRTQSRDLFERWRVSCSDITINELQGRDHFDILFDLSDAGCIIHRAALILSEEHR